MAKTKYLSGGAAVKTSTILMWKSLQGSGTVQKPLSVNTVLCCIHKCKANLLQSLGLTIQNVKIILETMDDVSCWQKSKGSILLIISAQLKSHHPMAGKNISLSKLQQLVSSVWKHLECCWKKRWCNAVVNMP